MLRPPASRHRGIAERILSATSLHKSVSNPIAASAVVSGDYVVAAEKASLASGIQSVLAKANHGNKTQQEPSD